PQRLRNPRWARQGYPGAAACQSWTPALATWLARARVPLLTSRASMRHRHRGRITPHPRNLLTNENVKSRHSLGSREKGKKKKEEEDEEEGDPCEVRRFLVWILSVLVYCSI
ncbi:hypothetical protein N5P37_007881, partial [Trichoderma harzianum]